MMKWVTIVLIAGFIVLYFMDAAFKIEILNLEIFIHSTLRFFTGFVLIGIGVFYANSFKEIAERHTFNRQSLQGISSRLF